MGVFRFTFWGTRGSIACPTPNHLIYGGNTSCIHVEVGDAHLILDAGTGMRELGNHLNTEGICEATILLTHTHWDHINGFPFFAPTYLSGRKFKVMAGHLKQSGGVRAALEGQMARPMFPVPLDALHAELDFADFDAGDTLSLADGVEIQTTSLNHPSGATGYRINSRGKSVCYITDTEHTPGTLDPNILGLISGADYVIYDSTYTDDEYPDKVGWGHSTWQEGLRLCRAGGAKHLIIFHHDPEHTDDVMKAIEAEATAEWSGCIVAKEGMSIDLLA